MTVVRYNGQLLLIMLILFGCRTSQPAKKVCEQWVNVPNSYAEAFRIRSCGSTYELIVFGPNGREDTLAVYQVDVHDALRRVAVVSTTHLAYIHALGLTERVVGVAGLAQVKDPSLANVLSGNSTKDIGTADGLDRETLIHLAPEALLDQPFGKSDAAEPLSSIPSIMIAEYLEPHPLGRAEWIRFFGVLFGIAPKADSLFAAIEGRYTTARDRVDAQVAPTTVFFGSNWQGTWWVPGGKSYMAQLIGDAGGVLQFSDPESVENSAVDLETLLHRGEILDHWGMVVAENGPVTADVLCAGEQRLQRIRPFNDHGLFAANSAHVDIFGKALVEPDVVLMDLIKVFHPVIAEDREAVYFEVVR